MTSKPVAHDPQPTSSAWDITGPETLLLLLPRPGDEVLRFGGLIAELCARGRPPFIVVIGDGAADGAASIAKKCEQAVRAGCEILGLPHDRLLFAGLRQGEIPNREAPLFNILKAAMTRISWRYDCNVIGTVFPNSAVGDDDGVFSLALSIAQESSLALIAAITASPAPSYRPASHIVWRLDINRWTALKRWAAVSHDAPDSDATELFLRLPAGMDHRTGD